MAILGFCLLSGDPRDYIEASETVIALNGHVQASGHRERGFAVSAESVASSNGSILALQGRPRLHGHSIDAEGLLTKILASGFEIIGQLQGAFAVAAYDESYNKVLLAVDRMGVERLTYSVSPLGLCFGTRATALHRMPGFDSSTANQSIYDFLFFHMVPSPYSIFENISKLTPAHILEWKDGRTSCRRYWTPSFERSNATLGELTAELHSLLGTATQSLTPDGATGAFLSGGLDSSTVAGFLSRIMQSKVKTFSIGFDVDEYDELRYARGVAKHFGCISHEYRVTPADIVNAFTNIAHAYDEPFGNSSVLPTYYCAKLAAENGIRRLFAGDGGDELFGGNVRYAWQKVFEAYKLVPGVCRTGIIEPLVRHIPPDSPLPFRKLRRYVEQAMTPLPERLGLGGNFAFSIDLHSVLSEDFAASVDRTRPVAHMKAVYDEVEAEDTLDKLLVYDWRFTLADNDLRKVSTMCELVGLEVCYPMLNDELVEFSTSIPASMKLNGLKLRSFYKRAMHGFLPDMVLKKSKHGFGLPFGVWLKGHPPLAELIYSNLADMKSRHIFKPSFIDSLVEQHRTGPASFYGYFIWNLAILEEWMKKHA